MRVGEEEIQVVAGPEAPLSGKVVMECRRGGCPSIAEAYE